MTFGDSKTVLFKNGNKRLTVIVGLSQDKQWSRKTSVQVIWGYGQIRKLK